MTCALTHALFPFYDASACRKANQETKCRTAIDLAYGGRQLPPLSPLTASTIAAPRAGRTVAGVEAIRARLGGEDPERKSSRQIQRGFKAPTCCLSHELDWRRGLGARPLNCSPG